MRYLLLPIRYHHPGHIIQPHDLNSVTRDANHEWITAGSASGVLQTEQRQAENYKNMHTKQARNRNLKREFQNTKVECKLFLGAETVMRAHRINGRMAKANVGGSAYNIINREYNSSIAGARLRYHDELTQYRSHLRANKLAEHNHTGFSPITGAITLKIESPAFPQKMT